MIIKRLKGTQDILPEQASLWQSIEDKARAIFKAYGYGEIRTPIIEEASLFVRSVGTETDIVTKQIYSFLDQGKRNICLRPEETASVCRAYLENQIDKTSGFAKFFYMGPMFRSERPQAGRYRQFHQIGVEAIGACSVYLDAEVLMLLSDLLKRIGVSDFSIKLNSLGCDKDKIAIKEKLKKTLKPSLGSLCQDCVRRYDNNILRILDCKVPSCRKILEHVSLEGSLCSQCSERFNQLKGILDSEKIDYKLEQNLVRGLDYYTGIVFEISAGPEKSQDAIAAGGRYDNLISDMGGKNTGATGFAIGTERIIQLLQSNKATLSDREESRHVFIVTMGEPAYRTGFKLLSGLRKSGIPSDMDYQEKSFKAQMRYANKINARDVIILGDNEIAKGVCIVKDMKQGTQKEFKLDNVIADVKCVVMGSRV
jgi:histidyl-tRNA synthetase